MDIDEIERHMIRFSQFSWVQQGAGRFMMHAHACVFHARLSLMVLFVVRVALSQLLSMI